MDFTLGIVIGASLLFASAVPPDHSDHFCASFTDAHQPCGCTISQKSSYDPTCGSDGVTYMNECYLECQNAMQVDKIKVQHSGACTEPCTCKCTGEYDPTCGTDNVTYSNVCTLLCAAENGGGIWIDSSGTCDNKTWDIKNIARHQKEFGPLPPPEILRTDCRRKMKYVKKKYSFVDGYQLDGTPSEEYFLENVVMLQSQENATLPPARPRTTTKQSKSTTKTTKRTTMRPKSTTKQPKSTTKKTTTISKLTAKPSKTTSKTTMSYKPECVCSAYYGPVCGTNDKTYVNFCVLFCVSKVETDVEFSHWGKCTNTK